MRYLKNYSHLVGITNRKTRNDYRLENIKYFFTSYQIILTIIALLIGLFLFDIFGGHYERIGATVIDKQYVPEESSNGYAHGTNGQAYVTTSHRSEEFIIVVKTDRGSIVKTKSDIQVFYSKKINDRAEVGFFMGKFSNINYFTNTLN